MLSIFQQQTSNSHCLSNPQPELKSQARPAQTKGPNPLNASILWSPWRLPFPQHEPRLQLCIVVLFKERSCLLHCIRSQLINCSHKDPVSFYTWDNLQSQPCNCARPVGVRYAASAHSVHTFAVSHRLQGEGHLRYRVCGASKATEQITATEKNEIYVCYIIYTYTHHNMNRMNRSTTQGLGVGAHCHSTVTHGIWTRPSDSVCRDCQQNS